MENFSSELSSVSVYLYTPADIVQHSFLIQNSISGLNLHVCQCYDVWDGNNESKYPTYTYSREFINNEEKCRKVLSGERSLLYTLNLDLPRGRERSLKCDSPPTNTHFESTSPHVGELCIEEHFYSDILISFIDRACRYTDDKLKILKWFIKLDVLERQVFHDLPYDIVNYFIECMHPGLDDLEFVTECFRKLDLNRWVVSQNSEKAGRLTNLLYQFHRMGRNANVGWTSSTGRYEQVHWTDEFMDFFLSLSSFHHILDVMKFKNAPSFSDNLHYFILETISAHRNSLILNRDAAVMSQQRHTLLLQVFWVYLNKSTNPSAASEFLYLIWNSVPDSFITPNEFATAFQQGFSNEEIDNVFSFYSKAVGGLPDSVEPRSLKHYCRTVIRKRLHERRIWLPEGIKEIGMPEKLQAYLNLGMEHFISRNLRSNS